MEQRTCSNEGCASPSSVRGLCRPCYRRYWSAGELDLAPPRGTGTTRHAIVSVDPGGESGTCSACGEVGLYYRPGRDQYICRNKKASHSNGKGGRQAYSPMARLKRRYGLTPDDYAAMWLAQDGECAICGSEEDLKVDHSHASGLVRALLCHDCNVGIGWLRDDPVRMRAAAHYVELLG